MKKTITIPDGWNEVSVDQFQEIMTVDPNSKDYAIQVISILLDKDPEEIRTYDVNSANKIIKHLEWAMKTPKEDEYKQAVTIDGVDYHLVENLNKFSGGEWWDMEEYLTDFNSNIHHLFALIYRNDNVSRKQSANIFKEKGMIGDFYGSTLFFSNVEKKSILNIQDYLMSQMKEKVN